MKRVALILTFSCGLLGAQPGAGRGAAAYSPAQMPPPPVMTAPSGAQGSNPFSGSVLSNEPAAATIALTLQDAISRGLRQNLGIVLGNQNTRLAAAEELRARSQLLPNLTGQVGESEQQVNLAAYGFTGFPGISEIVGPFHIFDARAYLSLPVLDFPARNNARAASRQARAAQFTLQDARDVVTQVVASGYLQVLADQARVNEAQSEVDTAQALYQRAQDQLRAGLSPALDALRAQVELQSEQTRLRAYQNNLAKDKLALGRLIGLALQQNFTLADQVPYSELPALDISSALKQALMARSDYLGAEQQVEAAEAAKRAAVSERYPAVDINADYGDIGPSPSNSHGTFTASIGVRFPIWDAGRIRSDIQQADAQLQQRKAELADLRGRIEYDIRAALLDLETAQDQVKVAGSSADLARQALTQAQDRFSAGVADNIEVVQAQNAVASATATYIDSLYADNTAKVNLARALGMTQNGVKQYLKGQ